MITGTSVTDYLNSSTTTATGEANGDKELEKMPS